MNDPDELAKKELITQALEKCTDIGLLELILGLLVFESLDQ